jgi:hypothetical protein
MPDPIYFNAPALESECEISGVLTSNVFTGVLETTTEVWLGTDTGDGGISEDHMPVVLDNVIFTANTNFKLWFIKLFAANPVIWRARTGTTDFVIYESESNKPLGAGKTYMENFGWVYQLKRLGNNMIAYGQNSVMVQMHVEGAKWGRKTIHPVGLKGFDSMCVDNEFNPNKHWFIDKVHRLFVLTNEGAQEISDYSNWMSLLGVNTVMLYDEYMKVVRIADGNYGFTFTESGLGWGPPTISGIGIRNGEYYVVSSDKAIMVPPLSFVTDIFDMNSRRTKHVHRVDFGADFALYVSLDYRWRPNQNWFSTPWVSTDFGGSAFIQCAGVEFRLKGKLPSYSFGRIDYADVRVRYDEVAEVLV